MWLNFAQRVIRKHEVPEGGKIMWHATTHLDDVQREGLKSQEELLRDNPEGRHYGLGGGSQKTVSLTSSREIAHNIAKFVKDLHLIAAESHKNFAASFNLADQLAQGVVQGSPIQSSFNEIVDFARKASCASHSAGDPYERLGGISRWDALKAGLSQENGMFSDEWKGTRGLGGLPVEVLKEKYGDQALVISSWVAGDGTEYTRRWWQPSQSQFLMEAPLKYYDHLRCGIEDFARKYYGSRLFGDPQPVPTELIWPLLWMSDPARYASIDPDQIGVIEALVEGEEDRETGSLGEWAGHPDKTRVITEQKANMWLKFAQADQEREVILQKAAKDAVRQAIETHFSEDQNLSPEELEQRADRLRDVGWKLRSTLKELNDVSVAYEITHPLAEAAIKMKNLATDRRGRTVYDPAYPLSVAQVVAEHAEHDEITPWKLLTFLQDVRKLLDEGIPGEWSHGSQRHIPLSRNEKQAINGAKTVLEDKAFSIFGIDRSALSDPENWRATTAYDIYRETESNDPLDNLFFGKRVELRNAMEEWPVVSFSINKNSGITISAELGDMSADEAKIAQHFQIDELKKFLTDVQQHFPSDWNKTIANAGNEGEYPALLSGQGKTNRRVILYRMMDDEEYRSWEMGETVPPGKYFATEKRNAVGTDFAGQGFREVFTFRADRLAFRGEDSGNLVSVVPMRLDRGRLTPMGDLEEPEDMGEFLRPFIRQS